MTESQHDTESQPEKRGEDPPPVQEVRTQTPQAPFGQDEPNPDVVNDKTAEEQGVDNPDPAVGGYKTRDPKSEMPVMPSVPETQGDAPSHDAQPDDPRERNASS